MESKIVADEHLIPAVAALMRPIVFTNGVFDILHRGHVAYLEAARQLGGSLVVALNTDASVRLLDKGPDRPVNGEFDRACVVAGLEAVSLVTWFAEPTAVAVLHRVRPDIYAKGGDYDIDALPETAAIRSWGGTACALRFVDGYSTTTLIERMAARIRQ